MEKKNPIYRNRAMMWRYRWKEEVLACDALLAFAFLINAGVEIRGLYMDDLYMWSCFADDSFLSYVFPIGSSRFRCVYYFLSWLEYFFVGNHINWFTTVNIILNGLIAYTLYRMARRLSDHGAVGFGCGILYLLSRMSYYQIGQVYGLMESMALWAAIAMLYCLYQYQNGKEGGETCYWAACGLYFVNCFIHERYMVLVPLFYVVLLMRREKLSKKWAAPAAAFGLVQLIRFLTIGTVMPAGTGRSQVAETFRLPQALRFAVQQLMHMLGINLGDEWLCPPTWAQTSRWIKLAVAAADLALLALVVLFVIRIFRDKDKRRDYLKNSLLFICFIGCCIASSSVTIRLELRWVYVSMTAALLFLSYMCGVIIGPEGRILPKGNAVVLPKGNAAVRRLWSGRRTACFLLAAFYMLMSFLTETYYRDHYDQLYFWHSQQEYNSLAEETWEKYGEEIFGKQIYILKNSYEVSDFYADTFFRTFDKKKKAEGTEVIFADSIRDFGQVTANMLILREDPAAYGYQDITDMVRTLKCEPIYGYYSDGWMDENAKIRVMAGHTGKIELELFYPGTTVGDEKMVIRMDGEEAKTVSVNQNILYVTLETVPYRTVELTFENNFYLEGAAEQRGKDRFSLIVNITAD